MKLVENMKKFPSGMMVIPLIIGTLINTFIPNILEIGGFTTALFKTGTPTMVGLFILCSGASINFKEVGVPLVKGVFLTLLKFLIGVLIGWGLFFIFGDKAFLGLGPLAIITAVTNSNGAMYTALAQEFGDKTDPGAIAILSLNDGPFLTMIALGTTGIAEIPVIAFIAALIPLLIGMILGNLDEEFRKILQNGLIMILPFNGFLFGSNINLKQIIEAGIGGIALGIITFVFTGILTYYIYSMIRGKKDPMGMAIGTTGGNAIAVPAAVAMADPSLKSLVPVATAQVAASVVITTIVTPILTGYFAKKAKKSNKRINIIDDSKFFIKKEGK
ncbi:MAG: 2-keto-3-deoxygluconate permease [Peptoniphilaceae bacterium]|nr:2-keto-3-deoxygluconate permease [Peptoniphilaceae bacterium]MDY3738767.1 2-keto-3-deoxygluconate permease [Peptoniphilaceae bacterium]